jgi:hypothetical protein
MYEEQMINVFIQEKLLGWTTRREWLLMDLAAVKVNPPEKYRGITFEVQVFEFKSDHDNPKRVFEQLPYYVWGADKVWLVLDEKGKVPKGLPCWLGTQKYDGTHFQVVYEPKDEEPVTEHVEFVSIKSIYLPRYALPQRFPNMAFGWEFLREFIRKWFANSILAFNKKQMIPYSNEERALLFWVNHVENATRHQTTKNEQGCYVIKELPVTHEDLAGLQVGLEKFLFHDKEVEVRG